MNLSQLGREVYSVEVTLNPTATGTWQASFDGGTNWIDGTDLGNGSFGWLVRGYANDDPGNLAVWAFPDATTRQVTPALRLVTGDEEIVVAGPPISS